MKTIISDTSELFTVTSKTTSLWQSTNEYR